MKKAILLVIVVFVFIGCASAGKGMVKKYALVIGNSDYESVSGLPNPKNDAEDMAKILEQFNFNVELCLNVNLEQTEAAITQYIENLSKKDAGVGFFYFAGLGVRLDDSNYLLPVDIKADAAARFVSNSYGLSALFSKLKEADNALNIVIIDTSFTDISLSGGTEEDGLDLIEQFTKDILYMQSSLPGKSAMDGQGRNSPFTQALLENIAKPIQFTDQVQEITSATLEYSKGRQQPYFKGKTFKYGDYMVNR